MKTFFKIVLIVVWWSSVYGQVDNSSSIQLRRDLKFYSDSSYLRSHATLQKNGVFLGFRHKEAFVKQWGDLPDDLRLAIYKLDDLFANRGYDKRNELRDFLAAVALVGTKQSVNHLRNFLTITTKNLNRMGRQGFSNYFKTLIGVLERQHLFEFAKDFIGLDNDKLELNYKLLPATYSDFDNGDSTIYIPVNGQVKLQTLNDLLVLENVEGIYLPTKKTALGRAGCWGLADSFFRPAAGFCEVEKFCRQCPRL